MWEYDLKIGWVWIQPGDYTVDLEEKDYRIITAGDGVTYTFLSGAALERQKLRTPLPGDPPPEIERARLHSVSPFRTKMQ